MKDYVNNIKQKETKVINIKEASTVYSFKGTSKLIIDNIQKNETQVLKLLEKQYPKIPKDKIKSDYLDFVSSLTQLKITKNNIEKIYFTKSTPLKFATIEITNACPFRCDHCYIPNIKKKISLIDYKKIVNELLKIGCTELLITGGEPMSHNNFVQMYLYAKQKGFIVSINSNIYLLNSKILEILKEYPPRIIEISLYGHDNKSYNSFTHAYGVFDTIDKNVNLLLKNNLNVGLKTVLTKRSKNYIYKIKEYADNLKVPFRFDYIIFPKEDKTLINPERCSVSEIIDVLNQDREVKKFFERRVRNLNTNIQKSNRIFQCSIGDNRIFIDAQLNIKPCLVVPIQYNLKNTGIEEAFTNFQKIKSTYKFEKEHKCMTCYKKAICRYCPGKFYMETGNYDNVPSFYCNLADEIIKEFGKND